ncbi:MAG TPA: hypothetical protein VFN25_01290 [Dokdonella sp.]|uniref:hypothetical protein n=1 Tax=Dokdonella sp. TaxID=2291710 RepID=UPI002D7F2D12|nr:hypothetical protein [Dokdonella sp.]HET9031516.1 hypothetical protein [Dokdonella sp.]
MSGVTLAAATAVCSASAQAPHANWLANPCSAILAADLGAVLPGPESAITRKPRSGKFESECLFADTASHRSLRLVLHPAKDTARVTRQLERLANGESAGQRTDINGYDAVLSPDGLQISVGVDHWLVTLIASNPMPTDTAHSLAARVVARIGAMEAAP